VRNEADRLHILFFDIMKIAFPDSDFHKVKSSINFSTLSTSAAASPKSSKRQVPTSKSDTTRGSHSSIDVATRAQGSSRSQRDSVPAPLLTHPGDLVICKKKRKDREKPTGKFVAGSPSSSNRIGPLNPGRIGPVSPAATNSGKSSRTSLQRESVRWGQGSSNVETAVAGIGDVQWAKPVKRMRSDTGKRRPSQL
jgi:hypothetical protein